MLKIGICGGIGSGKSTLCRLFEQCGMAVYNSDLRARELMESDGGIRADLIAEFGVQTFDGETLNRAYLSNIVFADEARLERLNAIVHPRVRTDFEAWCEQQQGVYVIMECAILFSANFQDLVDLTVAVLAPEPLRVERVVARDGVSAEQVQQRIAAQMDDNELFAKTDYSVVNIVEEDLDATVQRLDQIFKSKCRA